MWRWSSEHSASPAMAVGMPAERVSAADGLADALRRAYEAPGPHLIEAIIPPII